MIKPVRQGIELANDIQMSHTRQGVHLWWLGQSGFLAEHLGKRVLFDPYLSDSLTRKYAASEHPHVRMTELAIAPELLPRIDLVTSSHHHTDHLDADTLLPIMRNSPQMAFVIPEANRTFVAQRLGCEEQWPIGMVDGQARRIGEISVHGVLAAHNQIERDPLGQPRFMGFVVELGGLRIYHSGDTLHYPGMESFLEKCSVDLALLPINGNRPERGVAGNLFGDEAARLAKAVGARLVVPCHYEMFEFNTESPELFENTCREIQQPYRIMRCGESIHFV